MAPQGVNLSDDLDVVVKWFERTKENVDNLQEKVDSKL